MNPKGLKSTEYAIILSKGIQERSNPISPPAFSGRFRQNRMVKMGKDGSRSIMPNSNQRVMSEKEWGNVQDKQT